MPNADTLAPPLRLSQLAPNAVQSEIRAMSVACTAVEGINLAQGVCDTDPPPSVVAGALQAIQTGHNTYSRADGISPLRAGVARKFAAFNGLDVDPERNVVITSGATGAMHAALMALLDPGDECIVLEPFYGYHVSTLRTLRVTPRIVPLLDGKLGRPWELDMGRLRAAVSPRTRGLLLNSPSNPCGKVFAQAELEALAQFACEHNLFVFTDEMYEHFVFDGAHHRSIATLDGMRERTITISGFSKTFSVTGWRLGYLAASERWVPAISFFHDLTFVCAPTPLQWGAAAGLLELPESFYTGLSTEYQAKRDILCGSLLRAGMTPSIPQGAYYVLADSSRLAGADAKARARTLLRETGVAAVAGSAFFAPDSHGANPGEGLLRFCFAKRDDELAEACRRLEGLASASGR